jgi:hypothetical protein
MDDRGLAVGEGPAKVISVSLPEGTVQALRERAGRRGMSALIDTAVERYLRDVLTLEYLDEYQRENGAFTTAERQAAANLWSDAERLAAHTEPAAG